MKCPLCGYTSERDFKVCSGCRVNPGCKLTTCPHCGYQLVPEESSLVRFLKRLMGRLHSDSPVEKRGQP